MKDIINKKLPCELFNLEKGESFSLSPAGRKYQILGIYAAKGYALCSYLTLQVSSTPNFVKFKLIKLVYPRDLERPLIRKRYALFSSVNG